MESLLDEIESRQATGKPNSGARRPIEGPEPGSSAAKRKRSQRDDDERMSSRERDEYADGSAEGDRIDRTAQACIRCRKLKAKCINAANPPCDRCKRTGMECEFVPRANASAFEPAAFPSAHCTDAWRADISSRVQDLERQNRSLLATLEHMTRNATAPIPEAITKPERPPISQSSSTPLLHPAIHPRASEMRAPIHASETGKGGKPRLEDREGVFAACRVLIAASSDKPSEAWHDDVVEALWISFQERMPGLHFFQEPMSFTHPSPLLAAAILHVASAHYPLPELAMYQPVYLQAAYQAISALAIPRAVGGAALPRPLGRTDKFDNVLGVILVGLTTLGWIDSVGTWVSMAYRLLLDGLAEEDGRRIHDWRGLWEGLRTIELEHCSLHLIAPVLPRTPPESLAPATKRTSVRDASALPAISDLILLMQDKLAVFTGRGIPSVWQTILGETTSQPLQPVGRASAVAHDMATIDQWATQLDAWHARYSPIIRKSTLYVRGIVLLNYHLHKLFVLSIFYPLRKMTLGDKHQRPDDRKELLASARIVLQLQSAAMEIWSNWDLVMLTSASLIVLDAVQAGQGQFEDLKLVQTHMNSLRVTKQPPPSLRHMLARRLEDAMQSARTPPAPAPLHRPSPIAVPPANITPPVSELAPDMAWWNTTPFQPGLSAPMLESWTHLPLTQMADPENPEWDFQQVMEGDLDLSQDWPPAILNWFGQADLLAGGRS